MKEKKLRRYHNQNVMATLYAIQALDGMYYKPRYGDDFWRPSVKQAKIYTKKGFAKSAITYKLEEFEYISNQRDYGYSRWPHSYDAFKKFLTAQIVEVGQMTLELKDEP